MIDVKNTRHKQTITVEMAIEIRQEPAGTLSEYASIPIAFEVCEVYDVTADPGNQFSLAARNLVEPYVKDYDGISAAPMEWARRFDISNWAFFSAFEEGNRIGGATVACQTPDLDLLESRVDLAVLWDIRVAPSARRTGVGSALFGAAADWAAANGHRLLKIETQNINVAACRFYARQGCVLRAACRGAYPELPEEVQLLWYKDLVRETAAG